MGQLVLQKTNKQKTPRTEKVILLHLSKGGRNGSGVFKIVYHFFLKKKRGKQNLNNEDRSPICSPKVFYNRPKPIHMERLQKLKFPLNIPRTFGRVRR